MKTLIICLLSINLWGLQNNQIEQNHGSNKSLFHYLNNVTAEELQVLPEKDLKNFYYFKEVFDKNYKNSAFTPVSKIPKTFHWIWIGPKAFPHDSISKLKSWMKNHPGYVFKFWSDKNTKAPDITNLEHYFIEDIALGNLNTVYASLQNPGQKSDLLRYVILEKEGGIYIDHDVTCYAAFDDLNDNYDFFSCLEWIHKDATGDNNVFVGNCIFGCCANHPILKKTIENTARLNISTYDSSDTKSVVKHVLATTFATFFEAVNTEADRHKHKDIILPASFCWAQTISHDLFLLNEYKKNGWSLCNHSYDGVWH